MRAYIMTTGVIFGLITLAHLWRIVEEGSRLFSEPFYLFLTVLAAGLCVWAGVLLRRPAGSS